MASGRRTERGLQSDWTRIALAVQARDDRRELARGVSSPARLVHLARRPRSVGSAQFRRGSHRSRARPMVDLRRVHLARRGHRILVAVEAGRAGTLEQTRTLYGPVAGVSVSW